MALVRKDAALLVPDSEAVTALFPVVDQLLADPERMAASIKALGIADSADRIVDELLAVVQAQKK